MKNSQTPFIFTVLMMGFLGTTAQADTRSLTLKPLFSKWPYVSQVVRHERDTDSKLGCCKKTSDASCKMDCCN